MDRCAAVKVKSSLRRVRLKGKLRLARSNQVRTYTYGSPEWELAALEELGYGAVAQQALDLCARGVAPYLRGSSRLVVDITRLREAWSKVGRLSPGGFEEGDDLDGPTGEWIEDGSLTGHPGDWKREPPVFFERGSGGSAEVADAIAAVWNQIPFLLEELAARRSG